MNKSNSLESAFKISNRLKNLQIKEIIQTCLNIMKNNTNRSTQSITKTLLPLLVQPIQLLQRMEVAVLRSRDSEKEIDLDAMKKGMVKAIIIWMVRLIILKIQNGKLKEVLLKATSSKVVNLGEAVFLVPGQLKWHSR